MTSLNKNKKTLLIIALTIGVCWFVLPIRTSKSEPIPSKITCRYLLSQGKLQKDAQALYDSDPVKYSKLDSGSDDDNNDGDPHGPGEKACESLPTIDTF